MIHFFWLCNVFNRLDIQCCCLWGGYPFKTRT